MNIEFSKRLKTNSSSNYEKFMSLKQKAQDLRNSGIDIIDFTIGDPKEATDSHVINAIHQKAKERASSGYPTYTGEKSFKISCIEYMKREHSVDIDLAKEICITHGGKDAINHFALSIIDDDDLVICPNPCYPPYIGSTKDAGGDVYFTNLEEKNNFLIDFKSIPDEIAKKAKLIWINYPNSPTGVNASINWYKELIFWAEKYNIVIASDEGCYIDLNYKDREKPLSIFEIKGNKNGIIAFYSLSKRNNMTGYRVGFVCGDEKLISAYKTIQNRRSGGVPSFIQDVAALAIADNDFTSSMIDLYDKKKNIILAALSKIGLEIYNPDIAFYIWQKTPGNLSGLEFAEILLDKGIMVTPGEFLAETVDGINPGRNYVRFALVPELEKVILAGKIIENLN